MNQTLHADTIHRQFRRKMRLYTLAVVIFGFGLSLVSLLFYRQVHDQWQLYSKDSAEVYSLHDQLVQLIGYGGFIHDFKNLVLRKDIERYEPRLRRSISKIYQTLDELSQHEMYSANSLETVKTTIRQYELNLNHMLLLIESGASSEDIDQMVIVSDSEALRALSMFENELNTKLGQQEQDLTRGFVIALVVHLISAIILVLVLMIYLKELIKANQKESELTDEAMKGSQAKSDFLANMSHEIRTPLNGVMGMLQLLQRNLSQKADLQLVHNALFSTKSLLTIINDILDFSKIEANQLVLEELDFSISTLVESISSDLLPVVSDKSIYLRIDIDDEMPRNWRGDPVRVRQILLNLTSNAVKFTEKGGVSIKVSQRERAGQSGIQVTLTDTGIGMDAEATQKLFERFSQADGSVTRKYGGTGLGMAITKQLVTLMKGDIRVASTEGEGTKVVVFLPLSVAEDTLNVQTDSIEPEVPDFTGKRILIAEDNFINQEVVKAMLEKTNVAFEIAENGKEAIDKFMAEKPDLVLMDIQMPIMDGVQACLSIRDIDPNIPIVALTANVMKEDIEQYHASGFSSHLAKPVEIETLYSELVKFI